MFNKELNRRVGRMEEQMSEVQKEISSVKTQVHDTSENVLYIRDRLDTKVEETSKPEKNGYVTWGKLITFLSLGVFTVGTIFTILWNLYPAK